MTLKYNREKKSKYEVLLCLLDITFCPKNPLLHFNEKNLEYYKFPAISC